MLREEICFLWQIAIRYDRCIEYGGGMDHQYFSEEDSLLVEQKILEWKLRAQRRSRIERATLVIATISSAVFFLYGYYWEYIDAPLNISQKASYLISLGSFLALIGGATYAYVQGGSARAYDFRSVDFQVDRSHELDRITKVEERLSGVSERLERIDILASSGVIEDTIEAVKNSATKAIWNELSSVATKGAQQEKTLELLERDYYRSRERLLHEVDALGRRGTVNLALGVVTTSAALLILLTLALSTVNETIYKQINPNGTVDFVALSLLFLPKLSLAVFVQFFSLFFLRLYKAGLAEIKYFQNELTNLEVKYLGVVAAFLTEDMAAVSEASRLLLQVERNHVLAEGQSTVELEKHKIEQRSSSEILRLLPKILSKRE
ncbi:hypothetical protein [Pseudomonas putida]|uniref:hypothetical protein n=1 Tax=Pseudomonas putida TaxID=303 RepID=UPI000305932A|nr:hypothetical protein [Pseudomonas putida]